MNLQLGAAWKYALYLINSLSIIAIIVYGLDISMPGFQGSYTKSRALAGLLENKT